MLSLAVLATHRQILNSGASSNSASPSEIGNDVAVLKEAPRHAVPLWNGDLSVCMRRVMRLVLVESSVTGVHETPSGRTKLQMMPQIGRVWNFVDINTIENRTSQRNTPLNMPLLDIGCAHIFGKTDREVFAALPEGNWTKYCHRVVTTRLHDGSLVADCKMRCGGDYVAWLKSRGL